MVEQRPEDAVKSVERAHALRADTTTLLELARVNFAIGRREQAFSVVEDWLSDHPDDTMVRSRMAEYLIATGQLARAKSEYVVLLEQSPNSALWLNNLAWVQTELGATDEAIALARRALDIEPASADIADTLAMALMIAGEQQEALTLLTKAVEASPNNPTIRFHFATALSETGDKEAAIGELETLLETAPRFAERAEAEAALKSLLE